MCHSRLIESLNRTIRIECEPLDSSWNLCVDGDRVLFFRGDPGEVRKLWRRYTLHRYDFVMTFKEYLEGEGIEARTGSMPRHLRHSLEPAVGRN